MLFNFTMAGRSHLMNKAYSKEMVENQKEKRGRISFVFYCLFQGVMERGSVKQREENRANQLQ